MSELPQNAVLTDHAPRKRVRQGVVVRREQITPAMVRVILGGPDLADFRPPSADAYVKLVFPASDGTQRPALRTYTVRAWDSDACELSLDFVVHGTEGLAGPWAASATPGDTIEFRGPGGGYSPDPVSRWHLLVGDETALPAIAVAIEQLPADAQALVIVEVANTSEQQDIGQGNSTVEVRWIVRENDGDHASQPGDALVAAVEDIDLSARVSRLDGPPQVFLHGEAAMVRVVRRALRDRLGITPRDHSVSGYWRCGRTDDAWREEKRAWAAADDQDDAAHAAPETN